MNTTTIVIIVAALALIAFYLYNRSKPAPRGTYDDKNVRSSGSIGGGTRAHDAPDVRSSGSIGGGTRANDSSAHTSGGSIGGGQRTENSSTHATVNRPSQSRTTAQEPRMNDTKLSDNGRQQTLPPLLNGASSQSDQQKNDLQEVEAEAEVKKHKDEFRSGGSFGGSQR